jgi:hypothetical protein
MQRRFLGDSKDSFKWDYHDHLARELAYTQLTVALMMTPDGKKNTQGQTEPEEFPARECIIEFCHQLRASSDPQRIRNLPEATGATYQVLLHRGVALLTQDGRSEYFTGFDTEDDQLVFLDPDNGFEPQTCTAQHVRYEDVARVLRQVTQGSVVSVFQHFRYRKFGDDFAEIRERLGGCHSTAIYSDNVNVMIVGVTESRQTIERVRVANQAYAADRALTAVT